MLKKLRSITFLQFVSILLIIGSISIVYYPSLKHLPRSDQWSFLVDTIENDTTWGTFKNSYSYARTRLMAQGDTALFRPLLFLILSLEKGIFGNHFRWIQAIGILLHITVVLLLFIIMNQLRGVFRTTIDDKKDLIFKILGILFISFYAFNFSFTEIIIWSHLHAYIVFHIFTLLTFILLLKYISIVSSFGVASSGQYKPSLYKWAIPLFIWFFMLLGSFIYELGQVYAILVGIFFFALLKKTNLKQAIIISLSFIAIPIIYQSANLIDMQIHKGNFQSDVTASLIFKQMFGFQTIVNSLHFFSYLVVHPFFPSLAKISHTTRTLITELNLDKIGLLALPSLFVFTAWALFLLLGLVELKKNKNREFNLFFILLLFFYLGYFALIVFGRLNMRPDFEVIETGTYYLYTPVCFLVIFTFILVGFVVSNDRMTNNKYVRFSKYTLFFGIPIVIFSSILKIGSINGEFAKVNNEYGPIVSTIQNFIEKHPNSKLAFSLDHSRGQSAAHGVPFTTVLFRKYEDNRNPDYVVTLNDGKATFIPTNEYRSIYKLKDSEDIAPTLVKVGFPYHLFFYNGKYLRIPQAKN